VEGDVNWDKVSSFVIDNMGMSTEEVIKKLSVKYDISEAVKKSIDKLRK
jgi:pantoate kinase